MNPADLSGLTMDEMLKVIEAGTAEETAARKSLSDLVGAYQGMGLGDYYRALAGKARKVDPLGMMLGHAKTQAEISNLEARTNQAEASGELSRERANEIRGLLNFRKRAMAAEAGLQEKQAGEYLGYEGEGEQPYTMRARDVGTALRGAASQKLAEQKAGRALGKDMATIESAIIADPSDPKALGHAKRFNEGANVPYVYITEPKIVRRLRPDVPPMLRKVQLRKVGGVTVTAKMVAEAAAKNNMSIEEFIEREHLAVEQ